MRRTPQTLKILMTVACFLGAWITAAVAKPKITGLEFPIGLPADRPIARASITELGQSAQKRAFLRVALPPAGGVLG